MEPRYIRRQKEKQRRKGEECLICPKCGYVVFGQPVSKPWINKDPTTGKESILARVHAKCPGCGENMQKRTLKEEKINERKI